MKFACNHVSCVGAITSLTTQPLANPHQHLTLPPSPPLPRALSSAPFRSLHCDGKVYELLDSLEKGGTIVDQAPGCACTVM